MSSVLTATDIEDELAEDTHAEDWTSGDSVGFYDDGDFVITEGTYLDDNEDNLDIAGIHLEQAIDTADFIYVREATEPDAEDESLSLTNPPKELDTDIDAASAWKNEVDTKSIDLSDDEQLHLVKMAQQGDTQAANLLTYSVLKLIEYIARRMGEDMFGYEDAIEIATVAVAQAIRDYDETRTGHNGRTMKVSTYVAAHVRWAYLNEYTRRKRRYSKEVVSLDQENEDEGGTYSGSRNAALEDISAISPIATLIAKDHKERLIELLQYLDEEDAEITALRFGLHDGIVRTLGEVGEEVHLTGERVRQRLVRVLRIVSSVIDQNGLVPISAIGNKLSATRIEEGRTMNFLMGQRNPFIPYDQKTIAKKMQCDEETVWHRKRYATAHMMQLLGYVPSDNAVLRAIETEEANDPHRSERWADPHEVHNWQDRAYILEQLALLKELSGDDTGPELLKSRWGIEDGVPHTFDQMAETFGQQKMEVALKCMKARINLLHVLVANDEKISDDKKLYVALMRLGIDHKKPEVRKLIFRILDTDNLGELLGVFQALPKDQRELLCATSGFTTGVPQSPGVVSDETGVSIFTLVSRELAAVKKIAKNMDISEYDHEIAQKVQLKRVTETADTYLDRHEVVILERAIEIAAGGDDTIALALRMRIGLHDGKVATIEDIAEATGYIKQTIGKRLDGLLKKVDQALVSKAELKQMMREFEASTTPAEESRSSQTRMLQCP